MKEKKVALLDTDFISKTHMVQKNAENHLIDRVLELPNYQFFCHQQIVAELNKHNQESPKWLENSISEGRIYCFTDEKILGELEKLRGQFACAVYTQMLKAGCDAFSRKFFSTYYKKLEEIDYAVIDSKRYLYLLHTLDCSVGEHNNLGEIKSYILLQLLMLMFGEQVYVFCSEDKNARNGVINFEGTRCISLLTAFVRLKEERNWTVDEAEPYIQSLLAICEKNRQTTFRVIESSSVARVIKIPCRQVLYEIFYDSYIELQNGFLKYRY